MINPQLQLQSQSLKKPRIPAQSQTLILILTRVQAKQTTSLVRTPSQQLTLRAQRELSSRHMHSQEQASRHHSLPSTRTW